MRVFAPHGMHATSPRLAAPRAVSDRPQNAADGRDPVVQAGIGAISRQAVYDGPAAPTEKGLFRRIHRKATAMKEKDRRV